MEDVSQKDIVSPVNQQADGVAEVGSGVRTKKDGFRSAIDGGTVEERAMAVLAKFLFDRAKSGADVFRFRVRHADGRIANIYVTNEKAAARFDCLVEEGPSIPLRQEEKSRP